MSKSLKKIQKYEKEMMSENLEDFEKIMEHIKELLENYEIGEDKELYKDFKKMEKFFWQNFEISKKNFWQNIKNILPNFIFFWFFWRYVS